MGIEGAKEGGVGGGRFRVGELARLCGVNPRTVDFYTNAGLLSPVERSTGGHRFYDAESVHRMRLIKALRAQGLHLDAIHERLTRGIGEADALVRVEQLQAELRRLDDEVTELMPRLATMDAAEGRALRGALTGAASFALALSQDLMELLGQIGAGL